jgi:sulfite exporter TauE/SafE
MSAAPPPRADTPYFSVARHKLIVMSVTTLSMYQIYWFFRNFQHINQRTGSGGSPFWRAVAAPLTAHGLFTHVRSDAQSRFIPVSWSSAGLAVIYLGLTLICFFDYPWWTLALGSVFALMPVHATMEEVNRKVAPDGERNDSYSAANAMFIVLGVALTILGLYLTRLAQEFVQQLVNQL